MSRQTVFAVLSIAALVAAVALFRRDPKPPTSATTVRLPALITPAELPVDSEPIAPPRRTWQDGIDRNSRYICVTIAPDCSGCEEFLAEDVPAIREALPDWRVEKRQWKDGEPLCPWWLIRDEAGHEHTITDGRMTLGRLLEITQ